MDQGRVSSTSIILMSLLCMLAFHSNMSFAQELIVGGEKGWSIGVQNWPVEKLFKAGDILVFNYNPKHKNVVVVDKSGYDSCVAPKGSKVYTSGADRIPLAHGANFFLSSFPDHCILGQKIAIFVN